MKDRGRRTSATGASREPKALRVVSLHRPDAVSGVSSVGAEFASLPKPHAWIPLVIGAASLDDSRSPLRGCDGYSRVSWADGASVVEQCLLVRDRLRELGADVVVANDLPQGFVAAALNRGVGQRLAAWVHGEDDDWDELMMRAAPLVDAWAGVNSRIVRRTESIATALPKSCGVLTGCVDVPERPAPFGRRGADETLRLLYTGRLEKKHKRVQDLAALADELAGRGVVFVLSIAGDGPAAAELAEKVWPHVLAGRVNLLGAVPRAMIPRLVRANHMVLLMSRCEGAPTSVMEALAQGRPVAVSRGCGLASEVVRDGHEGIVFDVGDVRGLSARLEKVSVDRAWLVKAGTLAHMLAQREFSKGVVGERAGEFVRAAHGWEMNLTDHWLRDAWKAIVRTMQLLGPVEEHELRDASRQWLAELERRDPGLKVDEVPPPSREGRMLLGVLSRLRDQGVQRVALYGAGWHTRKLEATLRLVPGVVAIVDDRAGEDQGPPASMGAVPVVKPSATKDLGLDAIVISSDEHEAEMLTRAKRWAKDIPIVPMYTAA